MTKLVKKWKKLLKCETLHCEPVPKREWKRVAEMLEFTESATIDTKVKPEDIDWAIKEEQKNGGYFYQHHQHYSCVKDSSRAKIEVLRVRKEWKTLTKEDLFLKYL